MTVSICPFSSSASTSTSTSPSAREDSSDKLELELELDEEVEDDELELDEDDDEDDELELDEDDDELERDDGAADEALVTRRAVPMMLVLSSITGASLHKFNGFLLLGIGLCRLCFMRLNNSGWCELL